MAERGLDEAGGDGDPEGRLLPEGDGPLRPVYPKTPAYYGFTDHREDQARHGGRDPRVRQDASRRRSADPTVPRAAPAALPALGAVRHRRGHLLHVPGHLRHRLRQVHRGRDRAVHASTGSTPMFENLEGFPEDWKTNVAGVRSSSSASTSARASSSTASTRTSAPTRSRRRCSSRRRSRRCSTRCSDALDATARRSSDDSALPADAHAGARRALRVPVVPGRGEAAARGSSAMVDKVGTAQAVGEQRARRALGDGRLHLERAARARRRRGVAGDVSRRSSARAWRRARRSWA